MILRNNKLCCATLPGYQTATAASSVPLSATKCRHLLRAVNCSTTVVLVTVTGKVIASA